MATALLIVHGLIAVGLLCAITRQTLATCLPSAKPHSFFGRFLAVPGSVFTNAVVFLYLVSALLGAVLYLYFKVDIQPNLERERHWHALGFFDLKEDFAAIGLGLLPAYWISWRRPLDDGQHLTAPILTPLVGLIVWWSFLVGHVVNDIIGFGS